MSSHYTGLKVVITCVFLFAFGNAAAATITVNSNLDVVINDPGNSVGCTLREAILEANQEGANNDCADDGVTGNTEVDSIVFNLAPPNNVIALGSSLTIKDSVVIDGANGGNGIIIEPGTGVSTRFFSIIDLGSAYTGNPAARRQNPDQITFQNLTIRGASGAGSAALDGGSAISLLNTGVSSQQMLSLTAVVLESNSNMDTAGDDGGAIGITGDVILNISDSQFYDNSASDAGGAIHAVPAGGIAPQVMISGATFGSAGSGNTAGIVGGAIYLEGTASSGLLDISNGSRFIGNASTNSDGGAIRLLTPRVVNIDDTTFGGLTANEENSAGADGGAIAVTGAPAVAAGHGITISDSQFIGNSAAGSAGALDLVGANAPTVAPDYPVNIINSSFVSNTSNNPTGAQQGGGAIRQLHPNYLVTIDSSTFKTNVAKHSGGAILCSQGSGDGDSDVDLRIVNSTLSGNQADSAAGGLGVVTALSLIHI